MTITIGANISSLHAQRNLSIASDKLSNTFQKLSSGLRINKASDDPAGLAVADSLRADLKLASVAVRNANDGISTIAIADGALGQIGDILSRLAELAAQSSNGVYSTTQRSALQSEFSALGSEIERIATTTTFNGVALVSGTNNITLQIGYNASSVSQLTITNVRGTLNALGLAASGSSAMTYSLTGTDISSGQSASRLALDAINGAISSVSQSRGTLGATESRLRFAIENLEVQRENMAAAESRIRDVDVAEEAAELTRLSILQQAGTAVLAQANQQPALVMALLQ